jgi:hypothetical protein
MQEKIRIYDLSSVKIKIHDPYFCLMGASCIEGKDFALQKESLKIGERLTTDIGESTRAVETYA